MGSMSTLHEQWQNSEKRDVARVLRNNFEAVEAVSNPRYTRLNTFRNFYRDSGYEGSSPWNYRRYKDSGALPENMIRPIVDTLTAKLIRDRPRVTAFTVGGGMEARKRARGLSMFWDGVWQQTRVHANLGRYVREGLVCGDGVWHVRKELSPNRKKGKICIDLVCSNELYVDEVEAYYGVPRRLYRRRWFDRQVLMEIFPEKSQEIEMTDTATQGGETGYQQGPLLDLVEVLEAWRLPSSYEADNGRYVMVVGDVLVKDEPWVYDDFPFVRFCPTPALANDGFWGTGIVEPLLEHQKRLSETAGVVNRSQELLGRPWIMAEQKSEVDVKKLTNQEAIIVNFKAQQPTIYTPDPVSPQMYNDVNVRRQKMIEDSGVSRMSLTAQRPVGFDPSGKAIKEMSDVQSERFMEMGRALQESMVQLAKWTVNIARELDAEIEGGYKTVTKHGKSAVMLNWKDVNLDDDAFVTHFENTAWHGRSFSGKIADVERLINMQAITEPSVAAKLLDMPDTDSYLAEAGSFSAVVEMMAEVMLTTDRYLPPEPYMPLEQSIAQMQLIYNKEVEQRKGPDDEKLEKLRRWMDQAAASLQPPAPQILDPGAGAGAPPADPAVAAGAPPEGGLPPEGVGGGGTPVIG